MQRILMIKIAMVFWALALTTTSHAGEIALSFDDTQTLISAHVDILWEEITFYDSMAYEALGHSPRHVLLLH